MRVSLNLLPEEKKEIIRRKGFDRFLFLQAVLLFSVVVFYLLVLGGVFFIVHENRAYVESLGQGYSSDSPEAKDLSGYESEFRDANAFAAQANRFGRVRPDWSGFLVRMDRLIPPHVSFSSLSTKGYQVFVSGVAATRDDFLTLETSLKGDECFSDFQVPVSNLFSEKNVDFQFDFTIRENCLIGTGTL
ncbi:MAG: PilN domain-containing protein [Candidatus Moraniibacteriota bacterium]